MRRCRLPVLTVRPSLAIRDTRRAQNSLRAAQGFCCCTLQTLCTLTDYSASEVQSPIRMLGFPEKVTFEHSFPVHHVTLLSVYQ